MQNWFNIIPKNISLSIYIWVIFSLLPFYFIFKSNSLLEVLIGIGLIIIFFAAYRLSFLSIGGLLYICVSIMMIISAGLSIFYGYVYFSLFIAFFIGNVEHKGGFISLYVVHLVTSTAASALSFFTQKELFYSQWPFLILTVLGVILLPINTYNRRRRQKLEAELLDANKKISQLLVYEERQRIARDLHDTLGQKLSTIGLKSDLASRIIHMNPNAAKVEIDDINQTARTALKEVRDMLVGMRRAKIRDEVTNVKQLLKAANIELNFSGPTELSQTPDLVEDVLSMCLKEAVTNVVKHSQADQCHIVIKESQDEVSLIVEDNGIGLEQTKEIIGGYGLKGMRERLEFVNGQLNVTNGGRGMKLEIKIPNPQKQVRQVDTK